MDPSPCAKWIGVLLFAGHAFHQTTRQWKHHLSDELVILGSTKPKDGIVHSPKPWFLLSERYLDKHHFVPQRIVHLQVLHRIESDVDSWCGHQLASFAKRRFEIKHVNLERYLQDASHNAWTADIALGQSYLHGLAPETVASRLSQVLNTYWIVSVFTGNVAGAYNTTDYELSLMNHTLSTDATDLRYAYTIHCDRNWHAIFCVSVLVLFCASSLSAVVTLLRIAPDTADFVSALKRSDGSARLESGSSLDPYNRVRLLKNMRLRIGEASSEEGAGLVVIGQAEDVNVLQLVRTYR